MINEAIFCVQDGIATAEGVDTVMKLGMKHPLGPLALADLIGLDVCLAIMEVLRSEEHTSELQSLAYLVCRLLLEKKKKKLKSPQNHKTQTNTSDNKETLREIRLRTEALLTLIITMSPYKRRRTRTAAQSR